jgi:hypothetical protein
MVDRAATAHMGEIGAGFGLHLQQDNLRRRVAHMLDWVVGSTSLLAVCPPAHALAGFFFWTETGLEGPKNCFILTTLVHFRDRSLRNRGITTRSRKVQKGPQTKRRTRSGPLASTKPPTASLLAGHHATAGEQGHLERCGEQKPAEHRSKWRGALHPLSPDGETEASRLKPPGSSFRNELDHQVLRHD